ncbi:hypothetical protein AKJ09_00944 [Labilithrix luteola]|uniref:FAD-binding PCMH-type domain-containing protein n=1 Tax=Labilithrix luteola TaxID=1391654 RepID=A0A0K1PL84_9BACT|nr:FAD-binding oxidoreductase [Labilithrix luteola]AKU94280.1 hypothetical protein AKJ09_00944 [Labilithrix luteola]
MANLELDLAKRRGGTVKLPEGALDRFRAELRGSLFLRDGEGYEAARQIWNATVTRRPGIIVRCAGVADAIRTVNFAREHELLLAVRGGGHNIAGSALCEGGVVLDLSPMKAVSVDPRRRIAQVSPGALLSDFDHEAQAFGLATPLGINSTTGVAGLTLGGGFGWLSRKYGLTIDNLMSADVILADGQLVRASEDENKELFWGIRGGGGNFGVVTRFEFRLHPVGPLVTAGLVVFPYERAHEVLARYAELTASLDESSAVWAVLRHAPPLPFLSPDVHGTNVVVLAVFSLDERSRVRALLDRIRTFGTPLGEHVGEMPFVQWEKAFDPLLTPGARNYWKSHNFRGLSEGARDIIIEYAGKLPSPQTEIFLGQVGGAVNRVSPTATAYVHRNVDFVMNVHGRWESAEEDAKCIQWARGFFVASTPHAAEGVYVNFMTEEEGGRVGAAYGQNFDRLVRLKNQVDPTNMFCTNQNIVPDGRTVGRANGSPARATERRHHR